MFESGEVDAVYLVYAKFMSAMRQEPTVVRLLPMATPEAGDEACRGFRVRAQRRPSCSAALLPRYVDTRSTSRWWSRRPASTARRMTAMSAATKNAGEMIDTLTLVYNKARQAAITKEITEIVGGAEALR